MFGVIEKGESIVANEEISPFCLWSVRA